jgi:hypothetical protein
VRILCLLFEADLCGKLVELFQCDLLGSQDRGDDLAATKGEDITVGVGDLLNQMVGAKLSQ